MTKGSLLECRLLSVWFWKGLWSKGQSQSQRTFEYTKSKSNFIKYNILLNQLYTLRIKCYNPIESSHFHPMIYELSQKSTIELLHQYSLLDDRLKILIHIKPGKFKREKIMFSICSMYQQTIRNWNQELIVWP